MVKADKDRDRRTEAKYEPDRGTDCSGWEQFRGVGGPPPKIGGDDKNKAGCQREHWQHGSQDAKVISWLAAKPKAAAIALVGGHAQVGKRPDLVKWLEEMALGAYRAAGSKTEGENLKKGPLGTHCRFV